MAANATDVGVRVESVPSKIRVEFSHALRRLRAGSRRTEYLLPALVGLLLAALVPAALSLGHAVREQAVEDIKARVDLVAGLVASELKRAVPNDRPGRQHLAAVAGALPARARQDGTTLVLSDEAGAILSAEPSGTAGFATVLELVGNAPELAIMADKAGTLKLTAADGRELVVSIRNIPGGQLAAFEPVSHPGRTVEPWAAVPASLAILALVGLAGLAATCGVHAHRRRAARLAFDKAQRRIDVSLARARSGVWDWDISGGQVHWSASMWTLLGHPGRTGSLPIEEVNGRIHPADEDFCTLAEKVVAAERSQLDHEFRLRTASGEWLWLRARAEVTIDPDHGTRHLVGIAMDVSEERGSAERHAMADVRLRDAIEAISEAFVLWDSENRLVLCNSKFRNLHGLPLEKAIPGTSYRDIMTVAAPPVIEYQLTHDNPDSPGSRTLEAQLSDGRWLHINERRTKDGGFVSVGTDITEIKKHEEKLIDSERRLITTVRDLRGSRSKLQVQAQHLAELAERTLEASRAKTEFLAKMSHELRTPLNAVIGFAEVMTEEMFGALGNPRYLGYARDIHASGHFLLSIIDDILQMSRIDSGQFGLDIATVPLRATVDRALATVGEKASAKHLTVSVECRHDTAVQADPRALEQVLAHLLGNAVKFTPDRGFVHLRVRQCTGATNIFIEDSGIGIPGEFLPRLGRPFEQPEPEFCRRKGGSGLGLAISKALTEMHGGSLRVRSVEGVGTAVMVHLPASPPMTVAKPAPEQANDLPPVYLVAAE